MFKKQIRTLELLQLIEKSTPIDMQHRTYAFDNDLINQLLSLKYIVIKNTVLETYSLTEVGKKYLLTNGTVTKESL